MAKQRMYKADKISGMPGALYTLSLIPNVMSVSNARSRYRIPWHALAFDLEKKQVTESIRDDQYQAATDRLTTDIRKDGLGYFEKVAADSREGAQQWYEQVVTSIAPLSELSDDDLAQHYDQFIRMYLRRFGLGVVTFLYEHIASERLVASLRTRFDKTGEILGQLLQTDYRSFMAQAEELLEMIARERTEAKKRVLLNRFLKDYFYVRTSYAAAPVLTSDTVLEEVEALESGHQTSRPKIKKRDYTKELSEEEQLLVGLLKITAEIHDQRKVISQLGCYAMFRYLDQVVQRRGVPAKLAENIFWYEYRNLLLNPAKLMARLRNRKFATVLFDGMNGHYLEYIAVKPNELNIKGAEEIPGTPAAAGKARGIVRVVLGSKDFGKFKQGEILVAEMTRPDFVPLMKKAAAIVTDEGSLASHAAIVARELGVPCIVGTKIGTQVLKDGDEVEVDADKGVVRKL